MAQQYWSVDYWSTNYWSVDYWLPANSANVTGFITATMQDFGTGDSGLYWSKDWWSYDWFSTNWYGGKEAWLGTAFVPANFNGRMSVTFQDFAGAFVGSAVQNDIFDVATDLAPNWTDYQWPASLGTVAYTIDNFTSSIVGSAGGVGGVMGTVAVTMQDFTSAIPGTFVAPANETGTIAVTMQDFSTLIQGLFIPAGSNSGTMAPTIADFTFSGAGTAAVPQYRGVIYQPMDSFTMVGVGYQYPAGTRLGILGPTMDDFGSQFVGSATYTHTTITSQTGYIQDDPTKKYRIGSSRATDRVNSRGNPTRKNRIKTRV